MTLYLPVPVLDKVYYEIRQSFPGTTFYIMLRIAMVIVIALFVNLNRQKYEFLEVTIVLDFNLTKSTNLATPCKVSLVVL